MNASTLRKEFLRLLTQDSATTDRRRKEYNQAIFMADGHAVFTGTDLDMVMAKFDAAVANVELKYQLRRSKGRSRAHDRIGVVFDPPQL